MARRVDKAGPGAIAAAGAVAAGTAAVVAVTATRARVRQRKRARRFRLEKREPLPEGMRRIALGQLDLIADELTESDDGAGEQAIHEARKAFKRLRALVRLNRDQLGDDVRRRENAAFRDAARRLSGARDASVLVATLDDLIDRNRDDLAPSAFAGLRGVLAADRPAGQRGDGTGTGAVIAEIEAARARVAVWPLEADAVGALANGFARIQRRGRRAYRAAKSDPSTEQLHELRKRTKDLWHAAQILRPAAPKRMRALADRAHKLSNLLGDEHDLAVLLDAIGTPAVTLAPGEREQLEGLIERRRAKLRRRALKRARRLYAAKPSKLAKLVR